MSAATAFRPAGSFTQRHGIFVALTGGTNSGKSWSAMRLARGLAGPEGKIAAADTEGGRLLHLRKHFDFDLTMVDPPHHPEKYAEIARAAEEAGYDALVIDSFSMEWVGLGGVLDWQAQELDRMAGDDWKKRERVKMASWIKPKVAHKSMVYSFLQRRIPIIFAIRGEESVKPGEPGEKPQKIFKEVCNSQFKFEVTVSFRLATDRKGYIDLTDPKSYKMEGSHRDIFKDGEQLSERHGELLAKWAAGAEITPARQPTIQHTEPGVLPDDFKNARAFVDWSEAYLAAATADQAREWEAKYRERLGAIKARTPDVAADLLALFHERAPATADDMFPGGAAGGMAA
jgi:hypothetical protein